MTDDPFTPDEREAQRRAGFSSSGAAIRTFMPDEHREFFTLLPYFLSDGWPTATLLTGEPGFIYAVSRHEDAIARTGVLRTLFRPILYPPSQREDIHAHRQ